MMMIIIIFSLQDVSDYSEVLLPSIATKLYNASVMFEEVAAELTTSPQQVTFFHWNSCNNLPHLVSLDEKLRGKTFTKQCSLSFP